ncbi:MAG TPA: DUF1214 domain-containing protein [Sphingobium sp.]|uniref:DUF1214 domain-containing protein n=1 Tax=Sphingobium sp. TaxID=1912891 RepID=UPI002ECFDD59
MAKRKIFSGFALFYLFVTASSVCAEPPTANRLPEWKDYMAALSAAGDDVIGSVYNSQDPQNRQEAWNLLFGQVSRAWLSYATVDPDNPQFVPTFNMGYNIAAPNPDYIYYGTPLDGRGTYRLRGLKGSNLFSFIQLIGTNNSQDPKQNKTSMFNFFRLDQMSTDANGAFDFILSAERPRGYTGEWVQMDPRSTGMFLRSVAYDWLHERDPVVGIERLDKPVGGGRASAEAMSTRLQSVVSFVKRDSLVWFNHMKDLQAKNMWNRVAVEPWGTFPGQVYLEGLYHIADDEALVLETTVPNKCLYWSFLVGDMQFRTIDYANHQASLNAMQAKLDSDGKFRAVIAKRDPGVANWLDTGGYNEGVIQGRWNTCNSAPVPTATVVKLSNLSKVLPANTPRISSEERDRQMRDRRLGAQMRRKW